MSTLVHSRPGLAEGGPPPGFDIVVSDPYNLAMAAAYLIRVAFVVIAVLALAAWLIPTVARAQGISGVGKPGDYDRALTVQGWKRTFRIHVPPGYDRARRLPLVIVLHGGGGSGARVAQLTRFSELADQEGFVVVYPNGINNHWNDGRNVPHFRAQRENVDDARFLTTLIERLEKRLQLDTTRVYVTGISNGAMMCYRLACDIADRIAAIAPVCGAMAENLADSGVPSRPVPVLAVNGTEDPFVPWSGGPVGLWRKRGRVRSVPATIDFWVRHNRCDPNPEVAWLTGRHPADRVRVKKTAYRNGVEGSQVILYTVVGGGHTWPGGAERPEHFGRIARDLDATRVIWEFFRQQRRSAGAEPRSHSAQARKSERPGS